MKLFGKDLFNKKRSEVLYDFAQHGFNTFAGFESLIEITPEESSAMKKKATKQVRSPKEVYELQVLNQPEMRINCDPEYIAKEQAKLERKLKLIKGNQGSSKYGREEVISMIERLGNRLKANENAHITDKYPHTTTAAIREVNDGHSNLRFKEASEFVPDFPDDAIDAMDEYRDLCRKICGKDPVFYVLADKKDFGEVYKKRDPILFAQSPYGFFWQILGAWDEEMIYLGDL